MNFSHSLATFLPIRYSLYEKHTQIIRFSNDYSNVWWYVCSYVWRSHHNNEFFTESKIFKDTPLIRWSDIRGMKNFFGPTILFLFFSSTQHSKTNVWMNWWVRIPASHCWQHCWSFVSFNWWRPRKLEELIDESAHFW